MAPKKCCYCEDLGIVALSDALQNSSDRDTEITNDGHGMASRGKTREDKKNLKLAVPYGSMQFPSLHNLASFFCPKSALLA